MLYLILEPLTPLRWDLLPRVLVPPRGVMAPTETITIAIAIAMTA